MKREKKKRNNSLYKKKWIFIGTWFKSRKIRSWKLVDKASVQRHIADARVWCEELIGNGQSDRKANDGHSEGKKYD